MSADIFISFASKDLKVATTLCSALETRGFGCWISARDIAPGENFQVAIVRALRQAKIMLLVFTANSNTSEEMTKELALASQQKIIVIPLRVEDVTPNEAFAYEFATRQWIDAFADWELSLDQLSRRISHALADDAAHTAPTPVAAAPEPPAVEPPKAAREAPSPPPTPAPARRRSLAVPAAIAAGVAVIGALAAASLMRPQSAPSAVAAAPPATPTPAAVASAPVATPDEVIPEEDAPRLVKAVRTKPSAHKAAEPEVDIPY